MDRSLLSNLVLCGIVVITVWALATLGESQLDVYVSMFALAYFVCLAVFRPRRRFYDLPAFGLFAAFAIIVALNIFAIFYG